MANKVKQHFVPRFHLRQLSNEPGHKSIGLWDLRKEIFARHASLKNQAYSAYFYGKDAEIEDALAQIEGIVSQVLGKIIITQQLPSLDSIEQRTSPDLVANRI